ncbi:MAG: tRNA (N6-threonylcarbamoyladenosine(37)-N6)-methyltransferase TrmO [Planctomycetes bacterium]|nr:tRNA (N6-threonylcarbamoyladenosine(37)-N6)-methyltransferase TrmO [Planctomycetota bacterium]
MIAAFPPNQVRQLEPIMIHFAIAVLLAAGVLPGDPAAGEETRQAMPVEYQVHPIGHVRKSGDRTLIVLDKKFEPGVLGLDQWSHVQVIWWFDKNDTPEKRAVLQVHPRGDQKNPLTGVFATRSPFRPNLIALTLCKIVSVKENVVEVEKIDAFEGTPVLDIKCYAPGQDSADEVKVPDWAKPK